MKRSRRLHVTPELVPGISTARGLMDLAEQATIDLAERQKIKRQRDLQTRQRRLRTPVVGEAN